jgi:glutaminyl-peptide cyclotransferase
VGATDSAVPCAMMLHLAETMQAQLMEHKNSPSMNVSLQFVFFDGEEAFNTWTSTDSLYGSRHLAKKWEAELYPPNNDQKTNALRRMVIAY